MSKGLEALRDILGILSAVSGCEVDMNSERIQTITKELKALEIINNIIKFGDDLNSILDFDTYEEYHNHSCDYGYELNEEKFDLLKRWNSGV